MTVLFKIFHEESLNQSNCRFVQEDMLTEDLTTDGLKALMVLVYKADPLQRHIRLHALYNSFKENLSSQEWILNKSYAKNYVCNKIPPTLHLLSVNKMENTWYKDSWLKKTLDRKMLPSKLHYMKTDLPPAVCALLKLIQQSSWLQQSNHAPGNANSEGTAFWATFTLITGKNWIQKRMWIGKVIMKIALRRWRCTLKFTLSYSRNKDSRLFFYFSNYIKYSYNVI